MKKIFLTLILVSFSGFSQSIDWQQLDKINENKTILAPVKIRSFAVFKITNINKFLYEVTVTGKNISIQTEIPDEMKKLFRVSRTDLANQAKNENATDALNDANKGNDIMRVVKNDIQIGQLRTTISDELLPKCNDYIKILEDIVFKTGEAKSNKVTLINLAQSDISYVEMSKRVNKLSIQSIDATELDDFENKYKIIKSLYEKAESEAKSELIKHNKNSNKETATDTATVNKINVALELINKSYEAIQIEKVNELFNDLTYLSEALKNENNFTVIAPPVQAENDFVNYVISATPITTNSLAPHNSKTEFKFDIPVKKGTKVDFSVGPTVSFGSGAKDEKYFLEESTTPGKSILKQRDNNNSGVPGLAAFMHIYKRSGTETALGGLFGIGAGFQSIKDVDLSFYLGGSIILGKMEKVMINTGLSFLRVDRIKDKEFSIDKEYTSLNFDITKVTEKVFKPSFFVSLTYSLAKRVEN